MNRSERLARIAAKMKHPSMNVDHQFHLTTDKVHELDTLDDRLLPLFPAVSVSPEPDEDESWARSLRTRYMVGLLH